LRQFVNHLSFNVPKGRLTLSLEILADRAAQPIFNPVIRVNERQLQAASELPPDCGFTGAGQADEAY
jgi:hypothetical protein